MNNLIALIPARSGSKRIPHKNIKRLGDHPLLAYTIEVAKQSGIFDDVVVSTENLEIEKIAQYYGAGVIRRPEKFAQDDSPDIEWIKWTFDIIETHYLRKFDYFTILRPTNPFRTPEMIRKAWKQYDEGYWLKGIQPVSEHPEKMWTRTLTYTFPYTNQNRHHLPTQLLPPVYIQNGSIEIRPCKEIEPKSIQGFHTKGYDGFDINTEKDWVYAEWLIANGKVKLIKIAKESWRG